MPRRSHAGAIFMQGGPHGVLGNRSEKVHYDHGHRRRSGGGAAGSHPRRDRRRAGPVAGCGAAILGNLLPVPFIILLVRQVFDRLRKHAFFAPKIYALERRAHLTGRLVRKYRLLGLMLFVAIPLPGTGAWTGALIAAFLNIRLRHALPAITLGLLIAGSLVTLMTLGLIHLL